MSDRDHCQAMLEQICTYVDGSLDPQTCAALEQHLKSCENCRVVVDTLRKTITLYQETGKAGPDLPADVRERLYQCLDLQAFYREESS